MPEATDESEADVDKWWYCPSAGCDSLTRVCHYADGTTERECTECDWSFALPTSEDVNVD